MSAIVGVYYLDGRPVDPLCLGRMVERLAHRGPDGSGMWHQGPIGLGHRMLRTTPESFREQLPLVHQRGDLVLTADARIDNRSDLIAALRLGDRSASEITDSDLILAAYERWGESCPEYLIGDFAFVLWDERRQLLFCARDPMGVKPFYYYPLPGRLLTFASEMKALFCLPEVPRQINELRVADHLRRIFRDRTLTFYRGIYRLPPAHTMRVQGGQQTLRSYWSLDPEHELRLRSDEEYGEAFRERFDEAVRCRLRSAYPVGSTLSGGLDSSSIVCCAREMLSREGMRPLHTFSAIFPGLPAEDLRAIDEREYIAAVVAPGSVEPHYVHADRVSPLIELDRLLWHEDEAFSAPNLYLHWALYTKANESGVRVFLDGFDGDSAVSYGYGYLTELARTGRWGTLWGELTAVARLQCVSRRQLVRQFCLEPLVVEPARHLHRRLVRRPSSSLSEYSLVQPNLALRLEQTGEFADPTESHRHSRRITARSEHCADLDFPAYSSILELADKAAAAAGLEPRYPFFDRRLIEFCVSLPSAQRLSRGWSRVVLRRAMEGTLPPKVQWRPDKGNLSRNFRRKLLEYEQDLLERVIFREPERIEPYVNLTALRAAYSRYTADPVHSTRDVVSVYRVVVLSRWLAKEPI